MKQQGAEHRALLDPEKADMCLGSASVAEKADFGCLSHIPSGTVAIWHTWIQMYPPVR